MNAQNAVYRGSNRYCPPNQMSFLQPDQLPKATGVVNPSSYWDLNKWSTGHDLHINPIAVTQKANHLPNGIA